MKTKERFITMMLALMAMFMGTTAMAEDREAYVVYKEGTLRFCYDTLRDKVDGKTYDLNVGSYGPGWESHNYMVSKVVFEYAFKEVKPTSMHHWFNGCKLLTTIEGLYHLDTSEVTIMSDAFRDCQKLRTLSLLDFDTSKVEILTRMFDGCISLEILTMGDFNTSQVRDMEGMFANCKKLKRLDLSSFDTNKVQSMNKMFQYCSGLQSLDLSGFKTSALKNMAYMFQGCYNMKSLNMSSFNTSQVTDMSYLFDGCSALTSLYLSSFNTSNVGTMESMFGNCSALTGLDLSSFDTRNVYTFVTMFQKCSSLNTIYVGDGWNVSGANFSTSMFESCTSLAGEAGTTYDANHIDAGYAHVDGGNGNPGYLTAVRRYNLMVKGNYVTNANRYDILGDGGTIIFDGDKTLTLNKLDLANKGDGVYGISNGNSNYDIDVKTLTIEVLGDTKITTDKSCLYFKNLNLTINGPAELNLASSENEAIDVNTCRLSLVNAKLYAKGYNSAIKGTGSQMTVNRSLLEAWSEKEYDATFYCFNDFQLDNSFYEDNINGSDWLFSGESFYYHKNNHALWYDGYYTIDQGGLYTYDSKYPYKVKISPAKPSISTNISEPVAQPTTNQPMYNVAGQRVGKDYKGIVIQNGKKVVVR